DKKAEMVCFPEFQMAYSPSTQSASELSTIAETMKGPFVSGLALAARKYKTGVVATFYEKTKTNRVYDTAIVLKPSGLIASAYRKIHLYDALGFKESAKLAPGARIEKPFAAKAARIGLLICYDLRFPEMSRILSLKGAEVLAAPSAWVQGEMKQEHWQTMVKA